MDRSTVLAELGIVSWHWRDREHNKPMVQDHQDTRGDLRVEHDREGTINEVHSAVPATVYPLQRIVDENSTVSQIKTVPPPLAETSTEKSDQERIARISSMSWEEIEKSINSCDACALCRSRKNTVVGVGDHSASWMIIGEAPGAEEDLRGEPFVGRAGRLLDAMLSAVGQSRGQGVYIANVLKCRPPNNRNPSSSEIVQCMPYLKRQIDLVRPAGLLLLGRFAAQSVLNTSDSIASLRSKQNHTKPHYYEAIPAIVTYHPAYLLRKPQDKALAWSDFVLARQVFQGHAYSKSTST